MIVRRIEQRTLRLQPNGDLVIPAKLIRQLLTDKEDREDFGPNRLVVLGTVGTESGTAIDIQRDQRQEAGPASNRGSRKPGTAGG